MKTVGIFPASGALAEATIHNLIKLYPASDLILISRFPEKTPPEYLDLGVRSRRASFDDSPPDLQAAFSGVDILFLISYPSHLHELRTKLHLPAIDAAHAAHVSHLFYSSLTFAGPKESTRSVAEVMGAHLDTEAYLAKLATQDPSFTYTVIREGLYSSSAPMYLGFYDPHNPDAEIRMPHDGTGRGIAWVKREELGEASAKLIAQYAKDAKGFEWVNDTVLLTGPRKWSLAETAGVLSAIAGKPVSIKEVSVDEYVRLPQVLGVFGDEEKARKWATSFEAVKQGETGVVTADLGKILGREPEGFEVTAREIWG